MPRTWLSLCLYTVQVCLFYNFRGITSVTYSLKYMYDVQLHLSGKATTAHFQIQQLGVQSGLFYFHLSDCFVRPVLLENLRLSCCSSYTFIFVFIISTMWFVGSSLVIYHQHPHLLLTAPCLLNCHIHLQSRNIHKTYIHFSFIELQEDHNIQMIIMRVGCIFKNHKYFNSC